MQNLWAKRGVLWEIWKLTNMTSCIRYKSQRKNFKFHLNFPKLKALKSRRKTEYFPGKMSGQLLKTKSKVAIEC